MADTNQSTKAHEPAPPAYDAPDLSPKEFLLAVMRSNRLPLSERVKAAEAVAPYFMPRPGESRYYPCVDYHCKIVIEGIPPEALSLRQGQEPRTLSQESITKDPGRENRNQQSFSPSRSASPHPHDGEPGSINIETIIEDIKSGDIPELTLCTKCGHLMPYPCSTTPLQ